MGPITGVVVNPLVQYWSGALQESWGLWNLEMKSNLPGGELGAHLALLDLSEPANQRQLVPVLRALDESGVSAEELKHYPVVFADALLRAREDVSKQIFSRIVQLQAVEKADEHSYRLARELIRDRSAYAAYIEPEVKDMADRAYENAVVLFRDSRRGKILEKIQKITDRMSVDLHDPAVIERIKQDSFDPNAGVAIAASDPLRRQPFTVLLKPEDLPQPSPMTKRSGLTRAPPKNGEEDSVDAIVDAALASFKRDNPGSPAMRMFGSASEFLEHVGGLFNRRAFVSQRGSGQLVMSNDAYGNFDPKPYFQSLTDILNYVQEAYLNPRARMFQEQIGRVAGRMKYAAFNRDSPLGNIAFVPNPLEDGMYWDFASGPNGAILMRNGLSPNTQYVLFDNSPYVSAYLKESRRQMIADGIAGAENIEIRTSDLNQIFAPRKKLAVIRAKNVWVYIPGFEKRFGEMAGWIAEGGQFVIPMDSHSSVRAFTYKTLKPFLQDLIDKGWRFEYSIVGEQNAHDAGFDHLVLTKPAQGQRLAGGQKLKEFKNSFAPRRWFMLDFDF